MCDGVPPHRGEGGRKMAAVSYVITCVACRRILPRPPQLPSSSKPTSCSSGGVFHGFVSTQGLSGLVRTVRRRSPYQRKRFFLYNRRTGEEDRIRRGSPASVASKDLDRIPTRCDEPVEEPKGGYVERVVDRAINAAIVLAAGTAIVTKLLTIDHDYWQGWTLYEILRYAPQHNWSAYEEALKTNPLLAKMMISGIVYSLGDWIAQCYEGKPLFEFDRGRMFRSGFVGFTLHGSLSHYYYYLCEALFPFQDWLVVPAKVVFDQTAWSAIWNSIYYLVLGFLRFESPSDILSELKATFWPMLTAGWKLWPFAHLITYGVIPVEQRLLWVDCIELLWVTILSTYSNEKSEARNLEATSQPNRTSSQDIPEETSE